MKKRIFSAILSLCILFSSSAAIGIKAAAEDKAPDGFKILSTTPGRRSDGPTKNVATDTGIEFVFNRQNVDISKAFSIYPDVKGQFLIYESRSVFVPTDPLKPGTAYIVKLDKSLTAPDGSVLGENVTLNFITDETVKPAQKPELSISIQNLRDETFLSSDPVVVAMYVSKAKKDQVFSVEAFPLTEQEYKEKLFDKYRWTYQNEYDNYEYEIDNQWPLITNKKPAYAVKAPLSPGLAWTSSGYRQRYEESDSGSGIVFPETFKKGYYLIQVSGIDEKTKQTVWDHKLVQVNDLACYTTSVDGSTMIWLNDAATGKTAANRSAELVDIKTGAVKAKAVTDSQGVANIRTADSKYALLHIPSAKSGEPGFWQFIYLKDPNDYDAEAKYMSYIRMDRRLYKPTDKINIWGVVRGRENPIPAGTSFTVAVLYGGSKEVKTVSVTPAPDGTFSTEISIVGYKPEYYLLSLREAGGNKASLDAKSFYIKNYIKPEYTYETFSDKEFYLPGETPVIGLKASFFEGTPASGMAFSGSELTAQRLTDANGEISVPLKKPSASSFNGSCEPQYLDYWFNSKDSRNYLEDGVYYFPSSLILQAKLDSRGSKPSVNVKTNLLDTSRLKSAEDIYDDFPDSFLGKKTDTKVNITIKKETSKPYKEHKEVYYDWVSKKQQTMTWYEYKWETQTLSSYGASTKNGELNITNLPDEIFKTGSEKYWSYYYMEITATDKNGYKIEETVYLDSYYTRNKSTYFDSLQNYYFSRSFNRTGEELSQYGKYSYSWYDTWSAKLGETVSVKLEDSLNEKKNGQMLYYFVKDRIVDYKVTGNRGFSFTESSALLPSVKIIGAYFDGKHIYPIDAVNLSYDYESDQLDVKIMPEPSETKPGGTVNLSVEVRDKSGKPVQTAFNISVVDEALLAISRYDDTNPMEAFFGSYSTADYKINVSYKQYKGSPVKSYDVDEEEPEDDEDGVSMAGGGDGGADVYERKNFKDTAKFITGRTDSNGKAKVTMVVPDNLTSWKATAAAVDLNGARAGIGDISLRVTQPAFVQVAYSESYLASEDAGISLRMRGRMTESTSVKYHVELKDKNGAVIQKHDREGTVLARQSVNFGRLPAGTYKFNVTGTTALGADRIELSFTVSERNDLIVPVSKKITLSGENTKLDITPSYYPVVIGFADERYNIYMRAASDVLYGSTNNSAGIISSYAAAEFMKKYSGGQNLDFSYLKTNIGDYIVNSYNRKGVALHPYGDPDVKLTAFTAVLMGDKLSASDKKDLINYLKVYAVSNNLGGSGDNAAAYMGLAALGESVADAIFKAVKEFEDYEKSQAAQTKKSRASDDEDDWVYEDDEYEYEISYRDWNYLCAALAISGHMDEAQSIFDKRLKPYFSGKEKSPSDDVYKDTAAALVSSAAVSSSYANKFAEYLITNYSPYSSADAELAWFLKCFKPGAAGSAQFQYHKNGVLQTEKLDKYGIKYISFTKADLNNPMFRAVNGEVTATVTYSGTIQELCRQAPEDQRGLVHISKTERATTAEDFVGGAALKDYKTIVYTIRFKPGASQGNYIISDRIPSALKFYNTSDKFTVGDKKRDKLVSYSTAKQDLQIRVYHDGVYYNTASTTDSAGKKVNIKTEIKGDAILEITVLCQTVYDSATWEQQKAVVRHEGTGIAWLSAN